MTTSTTTKSDKLALEVNELLAYNLYRLVTIKVAEAEEEAEPHVGVLVATWRSSHETRERYRRSASALTLILQEAGITLKVTSSRDVLAAIKDLLTIPASQAYQLS